MSRINLPLELLARFQDANVTAFLLLDIQLDSGPQRLASLPFNVEWNGATYLGATGIGTIEPITETSEGAEGMLFRLPLVNQAAIASALTEAIQGRPVTLRLAVVDGTTLRVDPVVWKGTLDTHDIQGLYGDAPELIVRAEHQMLVWDTPKGIRLNSADHERRYPGDGFYKYANEMVDKRIRWPAKEWFQVVR